jgi:putative endopeptidase
MDFIMPNLPRDLPALSLIAFVFSLLSTGFVFADTPEETVAKAMDPSANPCKDFYRYACGGWIDSTPIPSDKSEVVRSFDAAEDDVDNRLYALFQEAASRFPSGAAQQDQIGRFYKSCMDNNGIEQNGLSKLQPYLTLIDQVSSKDDFLRVAGQLQAIGVNRLFSPIIIPDYRNSQFYTLRLDAGDPGFSDGDIYTHTDATSNALRKLGSAYMAEILVLLGEPPKDAKRHVTQIIAIEKIISKYNPEFGHPKGVISLDSIDELSYYSPKLHWENFFAGLGKNDIYGLFVSQDFLQALGKVLSNTPTDALKAYLRWSLISSYRQYLPSTYFRSISNELIYNLADLPSWKICTGQTSDLLGEPVGQLLIDNDGTKALAPIARTMIGQIKESFQQSLPSISWLDSNSLDATYSKIDAITEQIGYPQTWSTYTNHNFDPTDFLGNVIKARKYNFDQEMSLYNRQVDRDAWSLSAKPQTVNAFYYALKNQIHILGGLLRPPFINAKNPAPINYAAVGYVMSHEVMHGFGQGGHYFEDDGNYFNIWMPKATKAYDSRSQCVTKQYSAYLAAPKVKVNGAVTLEENLADVNGLKLAYLTFKSTATNLPNYQIGDQSLTPDQLFFIGYAQNFCAVTRPRVDAYKSSRSWWLYAPARYRAIGPIVNRPEFANAFNCAKGTPMNPVKKCSVL